MSIRSLCVCAILCAIGSAARADDWPQWLGPRRDGVWREKGILAKFPDAGPKVLWRTPIGAGYASAAVAGGKVFVTDRKLKPDAKRPANAFTRGHILGTERVLCLDASTGKQIWEHEYDCDYTVSYPAGPRTTPVVSEGRVYTLGTEGHLFCFEADTGKVIWKREFAKDYNVQAPLWGHSASPLLDGNRLICLVGGRGSLAVAFDKDTGKEVWKALTAREPGYSPPMIYEAGGVRQLIIWHPQALASLNPETGAVHWTEGFDVKAGLTAPTSRKLDDKLFVTSFYNGSMMMKLDKDKPAATKLWQGKSNPSTKGAPERPANTDGLHSIMATPFLRDGHIYGVCSYGELRCLKADTGERVWETRKPTSGGEPVRWANAFLVAHEDRFFLANEKGDLIIAQLSPTGYSEISRAKVIEADNKDPGRAVVWSHPAFANRCCFLRNDHEIVCVSLAAE